MFPLQSGAAVHGLQTKHLEDAVVGVVQVWRSTKECRFVWFWRKRKIYLKPQLSSVLGFHMQISITES